MNHHCFIPGRLASAAALLLGFLCAAVFSAPAKPADLEPAPLHVGFTSSAFRNVNPTDAAASLQAFAQTVVRNQGYDLDTSTRLFESAAACEAEIRKGGLTLVILDALEYLGMDIPDMEPAYVHDEQGVVLKDYLLLTRRDRGVNALGDLRGTEIAVLSSKSGSVSMTWLEVLLLEQGLGTPKSFFTDVEVLAKPSTTVLPVFFGRRSACVVDRLSFQTMVELNPQVGANLVSIAVSEPYLDSVTCITRIGYASARNREDFKRSLEELHHEPAGRQILTMFKISRLVPFKEEYLDGVRSLREKAARLKSVELSRELNPALSPSRAAESGPSPTWSKT